jgi:eukaryotic-like serine/threonine-protein kinase
MPGGGPKTVDPERWKRLRALMEPALGRPPAERARYLDDACAGDVSLRRELDSLLAAHEEAGSFIEQPAFDLRGMEAPPLTPGTALGRFVVLERVGSGGMGSVYAAYDSQLDRRVALKLLHAGTEERLRREAQALARLSHPNVITVYDVGVDEGRVFIAMEFVAGGTLKDWLRQERRSGRDVLGVFQKAGRGLEAAHAAGLVHRDFKPANVLVGGDKVVVADFGLAGDTEMPAGAVLGTPAYMAPEQHAGAAAGHAADQFSFCVALYEALHGARPFGPADAASTPPREPPAGSTVPAWLHHVLLRGLAREPSARFSSMTALLAALSQDPRRDFRRRAAVAGAAALLVGVVALAQWVSRREAALCAGAAARLAGVWDETRASAIDSAFRASGAPFADDARTRVRGLLDGYARDWARQRTDACEATRRGEQSAELLDRRMACLDQSLHELGALAGRLAQADRARVEGAVKGAAGLTPLVRCADTTTLMAPVRPPVDEAARAKVQDLRRRLAEAKAAEDMGDHDRGLEIAAAAVRDAEALGYWPLTAEALLRVGAVQEAKVRADDAAASLSRALLAAQAGRHDRVAAEAFTRLARVEGSFRANRDGGHRYAGYARALLEPLGRQEDLDASLAINVGKLWFDEAEYGRALEHYERALLLRRTAFGPDDPQVAETLSLLGHVHLARGERKEALARFEQAHAVGEKALGPAHPKVAVALDETGRVLLELGDARRALERHQTALTRLEAAVGGEHRLVATVLVNLGNAQAALGDPRAALGSHRRAEGIVLRTLGPEHPRMALVLTSIGNALVDAGKRREALVPYRRALALQEKVYGAKHPAVAATLFNLGETHLKLAEHARALDHYQRAMSIWDEALGADHYLRAYGLTGLGEACVGLGRNTEARAHLERALDIAARTTVEPRVVGSAQFALARALDGPGDRSEQARALAAQAETTLRQAGRAGQREHAAAVAWLEKRVSRAADRR